MAVGRDGVERAGGAAPPNRRAAIDRDRGRGKRKVADGDDSGVAFVDRFRWSVGMLAAGTEQERGDDGNECRTWRFLQ